MNLPNPYNAYSSPPKTATAQKQSQNQYKQDVYATKQLHYARKKLVPIIYSLMKSTSNHRDIIRSTYYLSNSQVKDAMWVSKVTNEFCKRISHLDDTVNVRTSTLDFSDVPTNSAGKVFVDTSMLFHLLELNKTLSYVIEKYGGNFEFNGTETEFEEEIEAENCLKNKNRDLNEKNNYFVRLSQPLFNYNYLNEQQQHPFRNTPEGFIVMSSHNYKNSNNEFKSSSKISRGQSRSFSKVSLKELSEPEKTSSMTITQNDRDVISQVTDVYGARDVIVNCITDLSKVRTYLETERIDVGIATDSDEQYNGNDRRRSSIRSTSDKERRSGSCCCSDCLADSNVSSEGAEETIICIKGKNEDENDIQIIVKQPTTCCRCKKTDKPDSKPVTTSEETESRSAPRSVSMFSQTAKSTDDKSQKNESTILHNKDSLGSLICSLSDEEGVTEEFTSKKQGDLQTAPKKSNNSDCNQIHYNEQNNLCLVTETGEELMFSFTVKPIGGQPEERRSSSRSRSDSKNLRRSGGEDESSAPDDGIPLTRTKVVSSLEFDVAVVDTKLRNTGILGNASPKIVVKLNEIGVDNLLRASRPAKCCRKSILNEKPKKCIPYSASLKSLPLDETDVEVIHQSLQMNLQKVKNSTDLRKNLSRNMVYYVGLSHNNGYPEMLYPWTISN